MMESQGLNELAVDLSKAGLRAGAKAAPVVKRGGQNVKEAWRENASGLAHAPAYPESITYDVVVTPLAIEAEVGPDKRRAQGALGNLIEFGSANNPPHGDGARALDSEADAFERAIADVVDPFR